MKEYELTNDGLSAFLDDVLIDVLECSEYNPIEITIGSRTISADLYPETFELLDIMLKKTLEIIEEEYNDEI